MRELKIIEKIKIILFGFCSVVSCKVELIEKLRFIKTKYFKNNKYSLSF